MPLPSCGCSSTPRARKKSNLSALRPWSSARSEPSTRPPLAWMIKARCRIGVVAPASRMSAEVAVRVPTLAGSLYPDRTPEIVFHPQCFASRGHFAGDDETRTQAFLDIANDESYDAVWFARGGYGSCRVAEAVMCALTESSRRKAYLGYSDA